MEVALETLEQKKKEAEALGVNYGDIERMVLLRAVDRQWMDHIDAMDALRRGIGLRGYGQRDPVVAYRQEGWDMFGGHSPQSDAHQARAAGAEASRARCEALRAAEERTRKKRRRQGRTQRSLPLREREKV